MKTRQRERVEQSGTSFDPDTFDVPDPTEQPPDLSDYYGSLRKFTRMVTGGYHDLFILDAPGGLGKTYNVREVLSDQLEPEQWTHERGFTTPLELYKTLYMAQEGDHVLFLDDMSGLKNKQKAIDMLKAATETQGVENWVSYNTSKDIDHPTLPNETLPSQFCFRGGIIISFNETPDNADFNALKDRGVYYNFDLTYDERISLIRDVAKLSHFHDGLTVTEQQEVAEWVNSVTNSSMEVSLRTFEEVCDMRHFGQLEDEKWREMAFDVFDLNYEKHLIIQLRKESELDIGAQIEYFESQTGKSRTYYYKLLNEIKEERGD